MYWVCTGTYSVHTMLSYCTDLYCSVLVLTFYPSTYWYVLFAPSTYLVHTFHLSMYLTCTEYILQNKSTYLRLKVHTFWVVYQYVPVLTKYNLLFLILYSIHLISEGYIRVHANSGWVRTLSSWFYCAPAGPSLFACQQFRHWPTHWTKSHSCRFIHY